MLTKTQLRMAYYTITRPDAEGPLRVLAGLDRRGAEAVCQGYWARGAECTIGYGVPYSLINGEVDVPLPGGL